MAGLKLWIAVALVVAPLASLVNATIEDCPTEGVGMTACMSCFNTDSTVISDELKEGFCVICAGSSDPWACNSCLSGDIEDSLKADACPACAETDLPYNCNSCLTSGLDTAAAVCPMCASFSDEAVGVCTSCMQSEFVDEASSAFCPDCTESALLPDGTYDFAVKNACNVCLWEAASAEDAEACIV